MIALEELKMKEDECTKEYHKAINRYFFAINNPSNEKNQGYNYPLDKRFATKMNDKLSNTLETKREQRNIQLASQTQVVEKKPKVASKAKKKDLGRGR